MADKPDVAVDPYSDAMTLARYALAPRAKSRAELHTQLLKRGVECEISSAVLDSLELEGLLNDLEFAHIDHKAVEGSYTMRQLLDLGDGFFKLHVLDEIVCAKINQLNRAGTPRDEIEIRLAYQTDPWPAPAASPPWSP